MKTRGFIKKGVLVLKIDGGEVTKNTFTWQYLLVARPCRISGIVRSALTLAASSSSSLCGQRAFLKASAEIRAVRMQARLSRRFSQFRKMPTVLSFNKPQVE